MLTGSAKKSEEVLKSDRITSVTIIGGSVLFFSMKGVLAAKPVKCWPSAYYFVFHSSSVDMYIY